MPVTRVINDIAADDTRSINFLRNLIEQDGGTAKIITEADGLVSVIGTFPGPTPDIEMPLPTTTAFAWMNIARGELGQKEAVGTADNPRIVAYAATTDTGAAPDSVPWCSSFVNFCITEAGLTGTNSKAARSWENWGVDAGAWIPGCVTVLKRGENPELGHVGFYVGLENDRIQLLGGNQNDAVSITSYDASQVVARRIPAPSP